MGRAPEAQELGHHPEVREPAPRGAWHGSGVGGQPRRRGELSAGGTAPGALRGAAGAHGPGVGRAAGGCPVSPRFSQQKGDPLPPAERGALPADSVCGCGVCNGWGGRAQPKPTQVPTPRRPSRLGGLCASSSGTPTPAPRPRPEPGPPGQIGEPRQSHPGRDSDSGRGPRPAPRPPGHQREEGWSAEPPAPPAPPSPAQCCPLSGRPPPGSQTFPNTLTPLRPLSWSHISGVPLQGELGRPCEKVTGNFSLCQVTHRETVCARPLA